MATRGFLIRFIDIGLIVLFGFLMISEIEVSSRVELAGAAGEEVEPAPEPTGQVFVVVGIEADGSFAIHERRPDESVSDSTAGQVVAEATSGEMVEDSATVEPGAEVAGAGAVGAEAVGAEGGVAAEADAAPVAPATTVTTVDGLAADLRLRRERHRRERLETIVLIEPSPASLVQRTVDVMDVCDRLSIQKSLRMDIEVVGESGEAPS